MTNIILLLISSFLLAPSITTLAAASPTILRIRTMDGSVLRVPLPNDDPQTTLSSILSSVGIDCNNNSDEDLPLKCQIGPPNQPSSSTILDISSDGTDVQKTADELGLKHGTMITILPPPMEKKKQKVDDDTSTISADSSNNRFDPYPDLAKSTSYTSASRRARALSRGVSRGMTYGDMSRIRSTMHTVEPQSKGPINRVYVCQVGAARFQNHCIAKDASSAASKKKKQTTSSKRKKEELPKVENRVALLFGTINKERVEQGKKKARTSLSSSVEDTMCNVAKVHAIWEPTNQRPMLNGKHYDEDCLLSTYITADDNDDDDGESGSTSKKKKKKESHTERAIRIASYLGLQPIGWIFSYADDNRHEDGDALPVHGRDAVVGSKLQIETMKRLGRTDGSKFVTLALDGRLGATEAFQLSDVCVQMVAEHVLSPPIVVDEALSSTRYMNLKDPVVVSGEETRKLDSVLLLVNTAMLSHVGLYSGGVIAPVTGNVKRGSGALLVKTRKRLLSVLTDQSDATILKELCDFDVLLALDTIIGKEESEKLCLLVRKYARGQKKGTVLDSHLKLVLQSALGG